MDFGNAEFDFGESFEVGASFFKPEKKEPEKKEPEKVEPTVPQQLTQAQIDDMFADLTRDLENEEEVKKAAARIIEAEAIVATAESEYRAKEEKRQEIRNRLAEAEKVVAEIKAELSRYNVELHDVRTNLAEAKHRQTDAEHAKKMAEQAAIAKRKFDSQERIFEALAKGKPWWEGIKQGKDLIKILPHQWTGARFLASAERALLGDGMGLGKTLTAIAALDLSQAKRILVVTPPDVASNFASEIRFWAPHRYVIPFKGLTKADRRTRVEIASMMDEFVIVVNYEAWRRDHRLLRDFATLRFDTVIFDESHTIKNVRTSAYQGSRRVALFNNVCPIDDTPLEDNGTETWRCPKCSWEGGYFEYDGSPEERMFLPKSVKRVWGMTGTPILNKPVDLYSILSIVDPYNFYEEASFLRQYCWLDEYTGRWNFRAGGLESLKLRLKGRFLARSLEDTDIVLPPQTPIIHEVEFDGEYLLQLRTIKQLAKYSQIVLTSGKKLSAIATIALITRQRQANVWPGGIRITEKDPITGVENVVFDASEEIKESIKVDKAVELAIEAISSGQRVAVFSQFATGLRELQDRLNNFELEDGRKVRSVRFDGSTPESLREQIKTNFNKSHGEEAKWDIVLANYKTGGVGLNLTAATTTIILDEEWNPGKRDQAYARTRRLGQDESTFVHVIRIPATVDTWMANLIEEKEDLIAGFDTSTKDIQAMLLAAIEKGELSGE